jgi:hypothetical protein
MKWNSVIGRVSTTKQGTTKAHLYYWTRRDGVRDFKAGYYGYGLEIEFQNKQFTTLQKARAYCEQLDTNAVIIEEVTA